MRLSFCFFLTVFTICLISCDPAYRIRRESNQLNYTIPFDCLTSSIEKTPGVKIVSESSVSGRNACKEEQMVRQISYYNLDGETIILTGCYDKGTLKTFSQITGGWVGQKPRNVPAILEKMREVELAIEKRCDAKGLSSKINNDCLRINCGE